MEAPTVVAGFIESVRALQIPDWNSIRPFANSYATRATPLLAVVGYLLLLNQYVVEWTRLAPTFNLLWPETPWRLVATYYGLVILAAASLIFQVRCPGGLKATADIGEFFDKTLPLVLATEERSNTLMEATNEKLRHHAWVADTPDFHTFYRLFRYGFDTPQLQATAVSAALSLEWIIQNRSRPRSRGLCSVLLALGAMITLAPAVATFVEITVWSVRLFF